MRSAESSDSRYSGATDADTTHAMPATKQGPAHYVSRSLRPCLLGQLGEEYPVKMMGSDPSS